MKTRRELERIFAKAKPPTDHEVAVKDRKRELKVIDRERERQRRALTVDRLRHAPKDG